jgi:hypothetical protein
VIRLLAWAGAGLCDFVDEVDHVVKASTEPLDDEDESGGRELGEVFSAGGVEVASSAVEACGLRGGEGAALGVLGLLGHIGVTWWLVRALGPWEVQVMIR